MTRTLLGCAFILCCIPAAWAGPMPKLPDLPRLPEEYEAVGSWDGAYMGLVGGLAANGAVAGTIGVVAGGAIVGETLIFGLEGMGLVQHGSASVEAALRLGLPVTDTIAVYSQAGLGADATNGMFLGLGASIELQTDAVTWRAQYRHAFDLSGDSGKSALLVGAVFDF